MKKIILIINVILIVFMLCLPVRVYAVDDTMDDVFHGAQEWLKNGENTNAPIDQQQLKSTSDTIYNILLGIAMAVSVAVGVILGIKYMMAGSEEKAQVKETLGPYIISLIVFFGAFAIWKIVVTILQ